MKQDNFVRYRNKCVGEIKGDVFYTTRDESQIFRLFNSINISKDIIGKVEALGVTKVDFKVTIGGKETRYIVEMDDIKAQSTYNNKGDQQWVLLLNSMSGVTSKSRQTKLVGVN